MEFSEKIKFAEDIANAAEEEWFLQTGNGCHCEVIKRDEPNGDCRIGIAVGVESNSIVPIIYLQDESYRITAQQNAKLILEGYDDYWEGVRERARASTNHELAEWISDLVQNSVKDGRADRLLHYAIPVLMNKEANERYVKDNDLAVIEWLDLYIAFKFCVSRDGAMASLAVTNRMLTAFGLEVGDLYDFAKENLLNCTPLIENIDDAVIWKAREAGQTIGRKELHGFAPMVVMQSGYEESYGANAILCAEFCDQALDKLGAERMIMILSSKEEVLCFNADLPEGITDDDEWLRIIRQVNSELPKSIILSGSTYEYKKNGAPRVYKYGKI